MVKKTTVDLTEKANRVKDALMPLYGLRNILSAGLLLLNKLSSDDLQTILAETSEKPIYLDVYSDRKKLLILKKIADEMKEWWDGSGYQIPNDLVKSFVKATENLTLPTPSFWRVDFQEDYTIRYFILSEDEQRLIQQLRRELQSEQSGSAGDCPGLSDAERQSVAEGEAIVDDAVNDAALRRSKKGRRTA